MKYQSARAQLINNIDLQQCNIHKSATQPGQLLSIQPKCKCCHLPYKKRSLNFWFSQSSILHLGPGVALFFRFILLTTVGLLIPTLAYSIVTTISNKNAQLTVDINISQNWTLQISNLNSLSNYNVVYSFILIGCALLLLIIFPFLIIFAQRIVDRVYSKQNSYCYSQPLAVLFKLDRPANYSQQEVIKSINQWFQFDLKLATKQVNEGFNVVQKVFFHFNQQIFEKLQNQIVQFQMKKQVQDKLQQLNHNKDKDEGKGKLKYQRKDSIRSYSSKNSYRSVNQRLNRIQGLKQKIRHKQLEKTNKFIVIFKRLEYAQKIKLHSNKKCFKKTLNSLIFSGQNHANVYQAPFPNQINFQMQHYNYRQKRKGRIFSWILTMVVTGICTGLYFGTVAIYNKVTQQLRPEYSTIILAGCIYVLSEVGNKISCLLLKFEDQPNKTQQKCSQSYHTIVTTIFLKGFSIIFVFSLSSVKVYQRSGLVEVITWLMIIWSCLLIIGRFVNHRVLYSIYKNINIKSEAKKMNLTQKQINKLFQSPENKLNLFYAQITCLVFMSFLYCSLIPISLFICLGTLIISLIVERICFVDIYKQPNPSSETLFVIISNILWKSPIFILLGQFYMIYTFQSLQIYFPQYIKIVTSILLAISILSILIPLKFLKRQKSFQLQYKDIKDRLINCYSNFNPLYSVSYPQAQTALKSMNITISKNEILISELNTMSKSLQLTLREKLFNQHNNPRFLQSLGNQDDSMYFEFDNKVIMPQKKGGRTKSNVPPIFKQSREDAQLKRNQKKQKNDNLVKLTHLVNQQQQQVRKKIKEAIKGSINKIK